jgi:hypothetical protein
MKMYVVAMLLDETIIPPYGKFHHWIWCHPLEEMPGNFSFLLLVCCKYSSNNCRHNVLVPSCLKSGCLIQWYLLASVLDDDWVCVKTPVLFRAIDRASSVHMPINLFEEILVSKWYILFLHWIFLLHLSTGDFFSCFPSVHGKHASHVSQ